MATIPLRRAFVLGTYARQLIEALRTCAVGQVLTYEEIMVAAGAQPGRGGRYRDALGTARRVLERDERIVFETVRKVGLRRCDDRGALAVGEGYIHRAHRASRRGLTTLAAVDPAKLDAAEGTALRARVSLLGAVAHATSARAIREREAGIVPANAGGLVVAGLPR